MNKMLTLIKAISLTYAQTKFTLYILEYIPNLEYYFVFFNAGKTTWKSSNSHPKHKENLLLKILLNKIYNIFCAKIEKHYVPILFFLLLSMEQFHSDIVESFVCLKYIWMFKRTKLHLDRKQQISKYPFLTPPPP